MYINHDGAGAYPQLPTKPNFFDHFQTYTAIQYGHSELPCEEKSKFELEEKKVQFITESWVFKAKRQRTSLFRNKLNFFFLAFKF